MGRFELSVTVVVCITIPIVYSLCIGGVILALAVCCDVHGVGPVYGQVWATYYGGSPSHCGEAGG